MPKIASLLTIAALALWGVACKDSGTAQAAPAPTAQAEKAKAPEAKTPAAKEAVARIVFIGQKDCCDCTRARIDTSFAALEEALGQPPALPVTRLQIDTQEAQAEPFLKQKSAQVMPAVYFVDAKDKVIDMLQGELTAAQIKAKL